MRTFGSGDFGVVLAGLDEPSGLDEFPTSTLMGSISRLGLGGGMDGPGGGCATDGVFSTHGGVVTSALMGAGAVGLLR